MKDITRQLFSTFAPAIVCIAVCLSAHCIHPTKRGSVDQTIYLLPKDASFNADRISMLTTQRNRYDSAMHKYQLAFSHHSGKLDLNECSALRNTALSASQEYEFVALETADSAFIASGLPRALPRP